MLWWVTPLLQTGIGAFPSSRTSLSSHESNASKEPFCGMQEKEPLFLTRIFGANSLPHFHLYRYCRMLALAANTESRSLDLQELGYILTVPM